MNQKINILPDEVINKIAAGEVVDRPASVLKELIENALDSGSAWISVFLEEGGKKEITVQDNGSGMSREDAILSIRRHATSKISSDEDLFKIHTFGFRGEALSAISAVTNFSIKTRGKGQDPGTLLSFDPLNQTSPALLDWGGEQGTTVSAKDLFYNVPARGKFQKSSQSEFSACLDIFQAFMLGNLNRGWKLFHNKKEKIVAPPFTEKQLQDDFGACLKLRAAEIFADVSLFLFSETESPYGKVQLLISPPGLEKNISTYQYFFVNDRWVKDKVLRFAVMRGYHSHLLKGRFPQVVVKLQVDPSIVDVNVHPSKTEVRFQYEKEIGNLVASGIRNGLRGDASWASQSSQSMKAREEDVVVAPSSALEVSLDPRLRGDDMRVGGDNFMSRDDNFMSFPRRQESSPFLANQSQASNINLLHTPIMPKPLTTDTPKQLTVNFWQDLTYLGSIFNTYLIFERHQEVLFADQHALHERVLYEQLTKNPEALLRPYPLLFPEHIELSHGQIQKLSELQITLGQYGLKIKIISETELEVLQVPTVLKDQNFANVLEEICESQTVTETETTHRVISTWACKGAVKAGDVLSASAIQEIIRQSQDVDFFHNCPHGRRVFRWYNKRQVESWFDRV